MNLSANSKLNDDNIVLSFEEKRSFHSFTIKKNDLQVMVISDPECERASAAMDVNVGYFSDPKDFPGLAHFLEHMLFLGTKKYPMENTYNEYLSQNGGNSNAFTTKEHTNYYFQVGTNCLEHTLDIFAQFFISPLFTDGATERELNAVDSENQNNLQNDYWRFDQLYKHFAHKDHPYHNFGTGNRNTLLPNGLDSKDELVKQLVKFHAQYYSANKMKLVVLGKESTKVLSEWVNLMFCDIPNKNIEKLDLSQFPLPYSNLDNGVKIEICPVKDLMLIETAWIVVPSMKEYYTKKPSRYLSHLLGHEGNGSLLALLKQKGFANELSAGMTKQERDWGLFSVTIEATALGIESVDQVVSIIYQYIAMLKKNGIQKSIFTECSELELLNFRFQNQQSPIKLTSALATRMHDYPIEHVMCGHLVFYDYDEQLIEKLLSYCTPQNMRLSVVSQSFQSVCDQHEPWYTTPYRLSKLSETCLQKWNPDTIAMDDNALYLPKKNVFIPTNFALCVESSTSHPILLQEEAGIFKLWYKVDDVFLKPKANVFMHVISPSSYNSPRQAVLTDLYVRAVNDALTGQVYDAELAGLKYVLQQRIRGLELYISGYSDKLELLLKLVLKQMLHLQDMYTLQSFDRIKAKVKRAYTNFYLEQPYQHAMYETTYMLEDKRWHHRDKLKMLDTIVSIDDVIQHGKHIFQNAFLEFMVHGNMSHNAAMSIVKTSCGMLHIKQHSLLPSEFPKLRVAKLNIGSDFIYQRNVINESDNNSAIQVVFQIGEKDPLQYAIGQVFARMIHEPSFHQLRTIEQLGYIVFSGIYETQGIFFLRFIIQSEKHAADYLESRIAEFVKSLITVLSNLTVKNFEEFKKSVVLQFTEKPKTPWSESMLYWKHIVAQDYDFKFRNFIANIIHTISIQDLESFYKNYLNPTYQKKLTVQICSKTIQPELPDFNSQSSLLFAALQIASKDSQTRISNQERFKRQNSLY